MTEFRQVRQKPEIILERYDGGLNVRDSPSKIGDTESPDCQNVDFGDRGSVRTREGTTYYATSVVSAVGCGLTTYQNKMVGWKNGGMFYMSGVAEVFVTAASGKFALGATVVYKQYQDILFCSDGQNGPWKYLGGQNFFNMGITIPSAPVAASNVTGVSLVSTGTWYYAVSNVNTQAVEGGIGTVSSPVVLAASASVNVSGIPLGSALAGVAQRNIYRSTQATGPFYFVKNLADNVTTSFVDSLQTPTVAAITDGSSPKPFTAIELHKERLWMPDKDAPTVLRFTEYTSPFISKAANILLMAQGGEREDINAICVQQDLVTAFKDGAAVYVVVIGDAADATTFAVVKSPANVSCTGPKAFSADDNGVFFVAKRYAQIVGFGYLSGIELVENTTPFLKNDMISRKIERLILNLPAAYWPKISMFNYKNRLHIGIPVAINSTRVDGMVLFDINRMNQDQDTDPGSWVPWTGDVGVNDMTNFNNELYGISSNSDGRILQFYNGSFTDASGAAIDSYFWAKEIGGDGDLESWVKDIRHVIPWVELLGSYQMNLNIRVDGAEGPGTSYAIDLTPLTSVWNTMVWNVDDWGPGSTRQEREIPVGPLLAKRIQIGFDNNNVAGQGFEVHSTKIRFNPRRQR